VFVVPGDYAPRVPIRACIEPGCPHYTTASRCKTHDAAFEKRRLEEGATGRRGTSGEWRRVRRERLKLDDFMCQNCGQPGSAANPLNVHHVDGDARNNVLENLETLCEVCHRHLHPPTGGRR
jgi:hypothetical protein